MGLFGGGTALGSVLDAGVGLAGGLAGPALSAGASIGTAFLQQGWARKNAMDARDWQEAMRATAYQTTVKDLAAAGLNPILAYQQGASATPSGPMATTPNIDSPDFSNIVGSAKQAMALKDQLAGIKADAQAKQADAVGAGYEAASKQFLWETRQAERDRAIQDAINSVTYGRQLEEQIGLTRAQAKNQDASSQDHLWSAKQSELDWNVRKWDATEAGQLMRRMQLGANVARDGSAVVGNLTGGIGKAIRSFISGDSGGPGGDDFGSSTPRPGGRRGK